MAKHEWLIPLPKLTTRERGGRGAVVDVLVDGKVVHTTGSLEITIILEKIQAEFEEAAKKQAVKEHLALKS